MHSFEVKRKQNKHKRQNGALQIRIFVFFCPQIVHEVRTNNPQCQFFKKQIALKYESLISTENRKYVGGNIQSTRVQNAKALCVNFGCAMFEKNKGLR